MILRFAVRINKGVSMTTVTSREREVYSLRLSIPERILLQAAASRQQERLSEFIRRTSLAAARRCFAEQEPD